jgi:hypothetical protein
MGGRNRKRERESSVSKIEYDIRVPSVVVGIEDEI